MADSKDTNPVAEVNYEAPTTPTLVPLTSGIVQDKDYTGRNFGDPYVAVVTATPDVGVANNIGINASSQPAFTNPGVIDAAPALDATPTSQGSSNPLVFDATPTSSVGGFSSPTPMQGDFSPVSTGTSATLGDPIAGGSATLQSGSFSGASTDTPVSTSPTDSAEALNPIGYDPDGSSSTDGAPVVLDEVVVDAPSGGSTTVGSFGLGGSVYPTDYDSTVASGATTFTTNTTSFSTPGEANGSDGGSSSGSDGGSDDDGGSSGGGGSSDGGSDSTSGGGGSGIGLGALTQLGGMQSSLGGILGSLGGIAGLGNIASLGNIGSLGSILGSLGGATGGLSSILGSVPGLSSILGGGSLGSFGGIISGLGGAGGIGSILGGGGIGSILGGSLSSLTGGLGGITGGISGMISGELGQLGGVTSMLTNMAGASSLTSMFGNSGVGSILGQVGSPALQSNMAQANSQSNSPTDPCANCSSSNNGQSSGSSNPAQTNPAGTGTTPSGDNPAGANPSGGGANPATDGLTGQAKADALGIGTVGASDISGGAALQTYDGFSSAENPQGTTTFDRVSVDGSTTDSNSTTPSFAASGGGLVSNDINNPGVTAGPGISSSIDSPGRNTPGVDESQLSKGQL